MIRGMHSILVSSSIARAQPCMSSRHFIHHICSQPHHSQQLGWRPLLDSWLVPPTTAAADGKPTPVSEPATAGDKAPAAASMPDQKGGCLPASAGDAGRERVRALAEWLLDPCLAFLRRNCRYSTIEGSSANWLSGRLGVVAAP